MSEDDKEWLKGTPFSKWFKRLEELENHDIFRIWKSVRKGGKTTLESMLNLNQGITELKEQIKKLQLDKMFIRDTHNNLSFRIANHTDCIIEHEGKIQNYEEVLQDILYVGKDGPNHMNESYVENAYARILDKLGGEKTVDALDGKTETPTSSIQVDSKPSRPCKSRAECVILEDCKDCLEYKKPPSNNFKDEHKKGLDEYHKENPSEQDAGSARQTELKLKGDQNFDDLRDVWQEIKKLKENDADPVILCPHCKMYYKKTLQGYDGVYVEKEDLEWLFRQTTRYYSVDPDGSVNKEKNRERKEKYLPEDK